jgi:glycosyltransferase involved in cell wall biosynthesis
MKILFDHPSPFLLMHGGFQVQIEQTRLALEKAGVEVEYLRWWDDSQRGDLIHYFGKPRAYYVDFARQKGMKVVMSHLLTGLGSRPAWRRQPQALLIRAMRRGLPRMVTAPFGWNAYSAVDACVMLTEWEAQLMREVFSVPAGRVRVIPNGVDDAFLNSARAERGPWLVCTAAITERKRVAELALAAVAAETPLWVIGKPYAESDPYFRGFVEIARENPRLLRYEGPIHDRAQLAAAYRSARGFVLLSTEESLSLSALEAAACECPLLLSDLPWARTVFGRYATYCPVTARARGLRWTVDALRRFHDAAPTLPAPPKPPGWAEIARQLRALYEELLSGPGATR